MPYALLKGTMSSDEGTERDGRTELTADVRGGSPREHQPRLSAFWDGGSLNRPLPASGSLTIGRSTSCDIRIDHPSVSRKHAILHLGPTPRIEDAGSQNGTRVAGRSAVSGAPVAIAPGEVVEVGQVVLVVQGADPAPAPRTSGMRQAAPPASRGAFRSPPSVPSQTIAPPGARPNESAMQRVERLVRLVAAGNIHVLVLGETGTGKEVIARGIHRLSGRRGSFQAINCAAIPHALLESELFGYRRGAFSGADRDKPGLVTLANQGTLFLDEIGDMPLDAQAKLLRVLQSREVFPLGATTPEHVDIRIVCATHR
ncbi:MAG: Type fimbriae expression regulatory protein PilR, partial [Labilithrix sp.]|nr:Type fimbriae expression regulatory protein PilR [Labilithrix sp.]